MKKFKTFEQHKQTVTPDQNVYQMFVQINNGEWRFRGLVSEDAKNSVQSEETIKEMNDNFESHKLLAEFTKKPVEESTKTIMFIPCPNADISIFYPTFEKE